MGRKAEIAIKLPKYMLVNVAGTVVDTAVLWLVSHYLFDSFSGEYLLSPLISFEFAVFFNFVFSYFYVWRDRLEVRDVKAFMEKYVFYNLSCTMTFCMKMGFLLLLKFLFGWSVIICNIIALCMSGVVNFIMSEWVIFR